MSYNTPTHISNQISSLFFLLNHVFVIDKSGAFAVPIYHVAELGTVVFDVTGDVVVVVDSFVPLLGGVVSLNAFWDMGELEGC